jgi:hypothetical protein
MYYFRFPIGLMSDGSRIAYSKGWHGTMPRCPRNVVVDLYNDRAGYGIAHTDDTFVPPEVTVITEKEALAEIAAAPLKAAEIAKSLLAVKTCAGLPADIWYGKKLADREGYYQTVAETERLLAESPAMKVLDG